MARTNEQLQRTLDAKAEVEKGLEQREGREADLKAQITQQEAMISDLKQKHERLLENAQR